MNRNSNTKLKQVQQELATAKDQLSTATHNKTKNKNKKKNKNKAKNNVNTNLSDLTSIKYASAPVNVGAIYGPSRIRSSKQGVQQHADYDANDGSERVEFSDTFDTQIQASSGTAAYGFGGTGTATVALTPNNISPRLAQFEEMYQWYAIRELIIEYCPLISTSTSVGFNLGINNNPYQPSALGAPTAQDVNELSPSMSGPVYLPNRMLFKHTGAKLFSTNTDGAPAGLAVQAYMTCILDGTPVVSTVYGKLRLSGIVDFYKQVPPTSTDPALVLRNRILHRKDALSRQRLFTAYMSALLKLAQVHSLDVEPYLPSKPEEEKAVVLQPSPYFRFGK